MNTSRTRFGVPPEGENLPLTFKEPLQVRLPAHIKRKFKAYAALRGMEPNELFVEVWQHYERTTSSSFSSNDG